MGEVKVSKSYSFFFLYAYENLARIYECIHIHTIIRHFFYEWEIVRQSTKEILTEVKTNENKAKKIWMIFKFAHPIDGMKCILFYYRFVAIWIIENLKHTSFCLSEAQKFVLFRLLRNLAWGNSRTLLPLTHIQKEILVIVGAQGINTKDSS